MSGVDSVSFSASEPCAGVPASIEELAASRRAWIDSVLHPWCHAAELKQLRRVELEWLDIAGRVDVNATLWTWAWERFPVLTHPEMAGVNETHEVRVTLADGSVLCGFPDSRLSVRGMLVVVDRDPVTGRSIQHPPVAIDRIAAVERLEGSV
jgi:hypothetical protein